jgi:hypothetical protein
MDKTIKIYLAAIITVIFLILFIDSFRTKPLNWNPTFSLDHKNPLDLYVFNAEIACFIPENRIERVVTTSYEYVANNPGNGKVNYLIIDKSLKSLSDKVLLNEVAKGSNLFISSEDFFGEFLDTLGVEYDDVDPSGMLNKIYSNYLTLSLTNKSWKGQNLKLTPVNNTFSFVYLDSSTTTILGTETTAEGIIIPNFVRIKWGKGDIYLHSQPQVFANVALLSEKSSANYVANILSYLPSKTPLVWFVKGQTIHPDRPKTDTPLSIVFRYPALRVAWLIMIYGLFLYILFHVKRRQRAIPVIKPPRNTTIEFVQTIGNLYHQEGSATHIVEKKIVFFLDRIRNRYYLDTNNLDDKFAEKLQSKSGKNKVLIDKILLSIHRFRRLKLAVSSDLVELSDLIEEFWENEQGKT